MVLSLQQASHDVLSGGLILQAHFNDRPTIWAKIEELSMVK